jgi:hypothetical protein
MAKIIKLNNWATLKVMSKGEFEKEYPDSDEEQINPETDLESDPDINPETDVEGDPKTCEQLADIIRRMSKGEVRRSMRDQSRMEVSERKANQPGPSAAEATPTPNETSDALAQTIKRLRDFA